MSAIRNVFQQYKRVMITVAITIIIALLATATAFANLTGSSFNTDDGNLKVDPGDTQDWAGVTEIRKNDAPTGQNDNSFTQGTKEDTTEPAVSFGSIPPNKSDLLTFGVYQEETGSGKFLHMYWTRVQEPVGTTNMDFEFNQNTCEEDGTNCAANGVTPLRLPGDLLITYELAKGGTVPSLFLLTWLDGSEGLACDASNSFPCWGDRMDLTAAGGATGSINTVAIPEGESDGLGALSARTFGEASVDLDLVFDPNSCVSFGSAYLKSRSSDSFTSALKDFIAPEPVNITNCGSVVIRKQTLPDEVSNTTMFGFSTTVQTDPANSSTFNLADDGVETITNVLFGNGYTVVEDVVPTGWQFVSVDCSASSGVTPSILGATVTFDIDDPSDVLDCTYTNQALGTIVVEKVTSDGSGSFDFTSGTLPDASFTLTTTSAGSGGKDSNTYSSLSIGTYDVAETVPAGWNLTSATCDDGSSPASIGLDAGETVTCTFTNARETGAILITKTRKHAADGSGDHPHEGVDFVITGGELDASGVTVTTDANGEACYDGLVLSSFVGDYTVTETVPTGYVTDKSDDTVTVSTEATCGDGNEATVAFHNTPLTDLTVTVTSQVPGGTSSTIDCVLDSAPAGDAISLSLDDLEPGTYTCTIVIDP
jgi:hypothetical protein